MPAGDDHSLARLLLDVIEQVDQNRINPLLAGNDGQAMAAAPLAV